jgi:hypothetical protein
VWKYLSSTYPSFEHFQNTQTPSIINDEEDIKSIKENLLLYYTSFNKNSYPSPSKSWKTLVQPPPSPGCKLGKVDLTFSSVPSFARTSGFNLGPNMIEGPLANSFGIDFNGSYTIALVFKNGNLLNSQTKNDEIELLKFYGNSPNNNALSLYYKAGSLKVENNIQFGKLILNFANQTPIECKFAPTDEFSTIEKDALTFVFVVKDNDKFRVVYMSEKNDKINVIANFNVPASDITFSNKEFFINRFQNWAANIFNVAVFKKGLTDVEITTFFSHVKNLYTKFNDPNYQKLLEEMKKIISENKCPYDKTVCSACKEIVDWKDFSQILGASAKCKEAISKYCKNNPKSSFCQCYDEKSPLYSSEVCKNVRLVLSNNFQCSIDNLSPAQLKLIQQKYNLMTSNNDDTSEKGKNVYDNTYTFDRVRVKYGENEEPAKKEDGMKSLQGLDAETIKIVNDFESSQTQQPSFLSRMFGWK